MLFIINGEKVYQIYKAYVIYNMNWRFMEQCRPWSHYADSKLLLHCSWVNKHAKQKLENKLCSKTVQ